MAEMRIGIEVVEQVAGDQAFCAVRSLAGTVSVGQVFDRLEGPGGEVRSVSLRLTEITRYDRSIEFVDPPHIARVGLTGTGVGELAQGTFLVG